MESAGRSTGEVAAPASNLEGIMSKRMRLVVEPSGHVEISYMDSYMDEMVTRRFSCGSDDHLVYVVEHMGAGRTGQVCERLAGMGSTLMARRSTLPAKIRAEYRRMRAAERAERAAEARR